MAGALAYRVGNRPVLAGGLGLQAAGLAWIAVIAAPDVGYGALVLPLVLNGIGVSMAIPVVQSAILGAVAPHEVGKASGANNMTQELGGVFGVAILVAVFTTVGSFASPVAFIDGFTIAMIVCAALAGGGAITALAVPRPESTPSQLIPLPIDAEEYPLESGEGDHARHRGSGGDQHGSWIPRCWLVAAASRRGSVIGSGRVTGSRELGRLSWRSGRGADRPAGDRLSVRRRREHEAHLSARAVAVISTVAQERG